MAVVGAGTVAAAPATNRSECMGPLVFRGGGRLTRFATRIPTLQPESLLYNHRHCFRCQNPHFTTANRENAHFATRLLRVFLSVSLSSML